MIDFIKKSKDKIVVLAYNTDRLQRDFDEQSLELKGLVNQDKAEIHFISTRQKIKKETTMILKNVISSSIEAVGYENEVLQICFHNGGVYDYAPVAKDKYIELMNAESKGKYFNSYIKGHYDYIKIN